MKKLTIPKAGNSIEKGKPLKLVLDKEAVKCLANNLSLVYPIFDSKSFSKEALKNIAPLGIKERAEHIGDTMYQFLPKPYSQAIAIINKSLTPPLTKTEDNGLAPMFYMPHASFVGKYGVDKIYNDNKDPFNISMKIQYELTRRFTCEFSIRPFIEKDEKRVLKKLFTWMKDRDPHVRRLCSEGTRPRLPWANKLSSFVKDPTPVLPILEQLKNDPDLYVRRSVANHVGDIAKDHMDMALDLCEKWLKDSSKELKWVIRHALRNPFKKGVERAIKIRQAAK